MVSGTLTKATANRAPLLTSDQAEAPSKRARRPPGLGGAPGLLIGDDRRSTPMMRRVWSWRWASRKGRAKSHGPGVIALRPASGRGSNRTPVDLISPDLGQKIQRLGERVVEQN